MCAEPVFMDGTVEDTLDSEGLIYVDIVGDGYGVWWEMEKVYTVKREAEKRYREIEKEIGWI
jgi:hypothetical protein